MDKFDFVNGEIILIDKPLEWTSFDVVNKLRNSIKRHTGIKKIKVGHAGTLDPLATGLLIICTGKFTKRIHEFMGLEKEYTGTFYMGATTPSFDRETDVDRTFPVDHLGVQQLKQATRSFVGDIDQVPPSFSAIKLNGNRAYTMARKNEEVELLPRKVHIDSFDLLRIDIPEVDFKVVCSKGTYIRALARDFGEKVKSGAYLSALRRTRIGDFLVTDAITPQQFEEEIIHISH